MVVGLLLAIAGIGAACALIYKAAVYAVPLAVGVWAGFAALYSSSGVVVAFGVGFVAGAIVFGIGQSVWNSRQPKAFRYAVALLFVVPAVLTGYYTTQQFSTFVVPSVSWQFVSAIVGAVAVGLTTFARLAGSVPGIDWHTTRDSHI